METTKASAPPRGGGGPGPGPTTRPRGPRAAAATSGLLLGAALVLTGGSLGARALGAETLEDAVAAALLALAALVVAAWLARLALDVRALDRAGATRRTGAALPPAPGARAATRPVPAGPRLRLALALLGAGTGGLTLAPAAGAATTDGSPTAPVDPDLSVPLLPTAGSATTPTPVPPALGDPVPSAGTDLAAPTRPLRTPPSADASAGTPRTVVVHRGDSLWSIAAAHLPPGSDDPEVARAVAAWYAANRAVVGPDPDVLLPGQVLTAPATQTHGGSR